jgi:hemolysin-activating ACP:hemolysin acyltransferase
MRTNSYFQVTQVPGDDIAKRALQLGQLAYLIAWKEVQKPQALNWNYDVLTEGQRQGNVIILVDTTGATNAYLAFAWLTQEVRQRLQTDIEQGRKPWLHPSEWNEGECWTLVDAFTLATGWRPLANELRRVALGPPAGIRMRRIAKRPQRCNFVPTDQRRERLLRVTGEVLKSDDSMRAIGYIFHLRNRILGMQMGPLSLLIITNAYYLVRGQVQFFFNVDGKLVGYLTWADLNAREIEHLSSYRPLNPIGEAKSVKPTTRWITTLLACHGYARHIATCALNTLLRENQALHYIRIKHGRKKYKVIDLQTLLRRREASQAPPNWRCNNPTCPVCA